MQDFETCLDGLGVDAPEDAAKKKKIKAGSFQGLGLGQLTYKAVMRMGYKMPTPIQRKTIPTILEGQDMVAMARTGSGKTAAFLIPIIERLETHSVAVGVRAVVLSPTRELAMQTAKFFKQLAKFGDLRCCLLVGGQAMERQFEHLASNPDVVIATPGRLTHHMTEAELSLARVQIIVFDEADRLFELGFAEQLQKVMDNTPLSRQILLFSATLPANLVSFTRAGIKNPSFVRLDVETTLSENMQLQFLYVRKDEKLAAALSVLSKFASEKKSTIMFVATRHHVEFFGELLTLCGLSVSCVYGMMDQTAREMQVSKFRHKKTQVMVTTDVAARGIDIPMLDHVVNFDFPPSAKLFVHRAGRTARAGRSGLAISLVNLEDLPYVMELSAFLGIKLMGPSDDGSVPEGSIIGALPSLEHEVEQMHKLLSDPEQQVCKYHRSMMMSYKVYNRMRVAASKESVTRSKRLLDEVGGPARLQGLIHPAYVSSVESKSGFATGDSDYIRDLRGFRPKLEAKQGNVLSTEAMRAMAEKVHDSKVVKEVKAAFRKEHMEDEYKASRGRKRKKPLISSEPAREDRPRLSKKQRLDAKKKGGHSGKGLANGVEDMDDLDITVDGMQLGSAKETSSRAKEPKPQQFYLSVERDLKEEAKEKGLEMEQYQLDLIHDEGRDIQKATSVMRWDNKKKKYLPTMVAADGRVVKSATRKNESGKKVDGEGEKTSIYSKWAKATKKRIPKIGEMEDKNAVRLGKFKPLTEAPQDIDLGDGEEATVAKEADGQRRKPVVPFHGEVEEKYLTHKQKRMMTKRTGKDVQRGTGKYAERLKTPAEQTKEKKKREDHKLKAKPHLRKKKAADFKAKMMERRNERSLKCGRTKSKMLVFPAGPKKWEQKKGSKRTFLTGAI